jgi:hypothetical protein
MLIFLLPSIGFTQTDDDTINYSFFSAGVLISELDVPGGELDASGYGAILSFEVRDHFHLFGMYESLELDDFSNVTASDRVVGLGTHFDLGEKLSLFGRLGYINVRADDGFVDFEDDGAVAMAGVRLAPGGGFGLRAGVTHVQFDESGDETDFTAGADLFLTESVALSVDGTYEEDAISLLIGGRLYFGAGPDRFRR